MLECTNCKRPLSGGLDTYGDVRWPFCVTCWLTPDDTVVRSAAPDRYANCGEQYGLPDDYYPSVARTQKQADDRIGIRKLQTTPSRKFITAVVTAA